MFAPLLQRYVYPGVAPYAVTSISPDANVWEPEQYELLKTLVVDCKIVG